MCWAFDLLKTMILSIYMTTDFPISGQNTEFMSVTNVDGALVMPKFITTLL